jgi:hypothetical protein
MPILSAKFGSDPCARYNFRRPRAPGKTTPRHSGSPFTRISSMNRRASTLAFVVILAGLFGQAWFAFAVDPYSKTDPAKTRAALIQTFGSNLDFCDQWVGAKDFKSLDRSVAELPILVAAAKRLTAEDDAAKIDALKKSVATLTKAAKDSDPMAAKSALAQLKSDLEALGEAKIAESPKPIEKSPGGFGPLMSLMDATFADAKTAATVGEANEAKMSALALAELSQYLAIDRNDERWRKQSDELAAAAREAATSDATDEKSLRKVFHDVYQRCEACHAVRRPSSKK